MLDAHKDAHVAQCYDGVAMFKELRDRKEDLAEAEAALARKRRKLRRLEDQFSKIGNTPAYLRDREVCTEELENKLTGIPFDVVPLWGGQGRKRVQTGRLKALCSLQEKGQPMPADERAMIDAMQPQEFTVRLYVLKGQSLMSMDPGGYSDPYLKVRLGEEEQGSRDLAVAGVTDCELYQAFEFSTMLPGGGELHVEARGHRVEWEPPEPEGLTWAHWRSCAASCKMGRAARPRSPMTGVGCGHDAGR